MKHMIHLASFATALSLAVSLVACGDKSVAKDYLAKAGSTAPGATTGTDPGTDANKSDNANAGTTGTAGGGTTTAAAGDATKGAAIISGTCGGCHNPTGLGKAVTLNASAVAKLDEAYTGKEKSYHGGFSAAFEQPGRADLEAALKAVP